MEHSAFEALMTGVNVFVFVIALSAGILLMSNIIDMVNFANEQAIVGMNGTIAESVATITDRIYTGAQILNYYSTEIEPKETLGEVTENIFYVKMSESGQLRTLESFVEDQPIWQYIDKNFILRYKETRGDKHVYVFSLTEK